MQETSNSQETETKAFAKRQDTIVESSFEQSPPLRSHRRRRNQQLQEQHSLWKLPKSSIQEYAKWIEEKGSERTEAEQKFLWKYQRRCLIQQDKLSTETLREYVFRLLEKKERTPAENRLIRQFQRRRMAARQERRERRERRERNGLMPERQPTIFWRRNGPNKAAMTASPSSPAMTSNLATLRESMDKLGLSSQKLRDTNMET